MEKAESLFTSASLVPDSSAPVPKNLLTTEASWAKGFLGSRLHHALPAPLHTGLTGLLKAVPA